MKNFFKYIPDEFVTIDDKEPPWITEEIKNNIIQKNLIYNSYISNGKTTTDYQKLHTNIGNEISQVISKRKKNYNHLPKKLSDPLQVLKRAGPMVLKFL